MDYDKETVRYKGFDIEIMQDDSCYSPQDWRDENLFLVAFHRDFSVTTDDIKEPSDIEEYKDKFHLITLYAYIHSGVSLSIADDVYPYNDKWDSCQVGVVLASKEEFKTRKEAVERAIGLVGVWNDYLSGNVWYYNVEGIEGVGCGGFFGDYEKSGLLDDAKGEIDYYLNQLYGKKNKKLKDLIKNKVDFSKRENILAKIN